MHKALQKRTRKLSLSSPRTTQWTMRTPKSRSNPGSSTAAHILMLHMPTYGCCHSKVTVRFVAGSKQRFHQGGPVQSSADNPVSSAALGVGGALFCLDCQPILQYHQHNHCGANGMDHRTQQECSDNCHVLLVPTGKSETQRHTRLLSIFDMSHHVCRPDIRRMSLRKQLFPCVGLPSIDSNRMCSCALDHLSADQSSWLLPLRSLAFLSTDLFRRSCQALLLQIRTFKGSVKSVPCVLLCFGDRHHRLQGLHLRSGANWQSFDDDSAKPSAHCWDCSSTSFKTFRGQPTAADKPFQSSCCSLSRLAADNRRSQETNPAPCQCRVCTCMFWVSRLSPRHGDLWCDNWDYNDWRYNNWCCHERCYCNGHCNDWCCYNWCCENCNN